MNIQWYPGHMAKAKRQIQENIKLIDIVIELIDARIPKSSRNPDISEIHSKPYVLAAAKSDLADPSCSDIWLNYWRQNNETVVLLDLITGRGLNQLNAEIRKFMPKLKRPARVLIVGIPNVGKSTLINRLVGKGSTRVGAKPGVTRGKQWINARGMQLLDTPGILWPKFENQETAYKLAAIAAIKDEVLDVEKLVNWLLRFLMENYFELLKKRYGILAQTEDIESVLVNIGKRRGCLQSKGIVDKWKTAQIILKDFRSGLIGPITLELP